MTLSPTAGDRDVRGLLDVIAAARENPAPVGLAHSALTGLAALIPCDQISFFELDSARQATPFTQSLAPDADDDDDEAFWTNYESCYACCYPDRNDDRPVTAFSDFYGQLERRRVGMYSDYYRPHGIEESLGLVLPIAPRRTLRLEFFRGAGPDFSERERSILLLFRPHLREICVEQQLFGQAPLPLTPRQRELLRLVAEGRTNAQVARRLGISEGTVRKHLENVFERLGVTSRTAAVLRAFPPQRSA